MKVSEYNKEFYRLGNCYGLNEPKDLMIARYVNGFEFIIQNELSTQWFHYVEEAF